MDTGDKVFFDDTFKNLVEIGHGGGGTIYKAHHVRLDKDVVLKKIHTGLLNSIVHRAELDILKNLKHQYLPQVYDFYESGDDVYTVMEFISGKSFSEWMKEGRRFTRKEIVKWAKQLCEVVNYLHSQKPPIIHCDIKPANLMLTDDGNICLIDFNISGVKSEEGLATIGYSDGYAPIEQFAIVANRIVNGMKTHSADPGDATAFMSESGETELLKNSDKTSAAGVSNRSDFGATGKTELAHCSDMTEHMLDSDEIACMYDLDKTLTMGDCEKTILMPMTGETASRSSGTPQDNIIWSVSERSMLRGLSDEDWAKAMRMASLHVPNPVLDERTDIYSVGATLYYILTGIRPKPFYKDRVPVEDVANNICEGLAYLIDKAMAMMPEERFQTSAELLKTANNLDVYDRRYKALVRKQTITAALLAALAAASVICIFAGHRLMGYEQEDSYYETALSYYNDKEYDECISYIEENVLNDSTEKDDASYGRFYYIYASCCFEEGNYSEAAENYKRAIELQPEEISYYRDYVISLARDNKIYEAEEALEMAKSAGITSDVITLLQGEIDAAQGNYENAEKAFWECIDTTEDSYTKLRAYTKLDTVYADMYGGEEEYVKRMALLEEGRDVLDASDTATLTETLAQVYIDYADYLSEKGDTEGMSHFNTKAIELFKENEKQGYATFADRLNIAVLYEKNGEYQEAKDQLLSMTETYSDNYSLYMKLSYVELEIQDAKDKLSRNYAQFKKYYDTAIKAYSENATVEDSEMLVLEQLYEDLVANGWI